MIDATPQQEQMSEWRAPMLVNLSVPETQAGFVYWPTERGLFYFPTLGGSFLVGTQSAPGS